MMSQAKMLQWLGGGLAVSLLVLLWPGQAPEQSGGDVLQATLGDYQVRLQFAEPLTAGDNLVQVRVLDNTGWPVKDARLEIMGTLAPKPAASSHQHHEGMAGMEGMDMAAMTAMDSAAPEMGGMHSMGHAKVAGPAVIVPNATPGMAGDYAGEVTFATAGDWLLNTRLTRNGQTLNAELAVTVANRSPPWGIIAFFIALNALIIWVASVTRRNPRFFLKQA